MNNTWKSATTWKSAFNDSQTTFPLIHVGQEQPAQDQAASATAAVAAPDVGVEGAAVEVIGSDDETEGVELEHSDLMAESDAHHKKGTFKDSLVLRHM